MGIGKNQLLMLAGGDIHSNQMEAVSSLKQSFQLTLPSCQVIVHPQNSLAQADSSLQSIFEAIQSSLAVVVVVGKNTFAMVDDFILWSLALSVGTPVLPMLMGTELSDENLERLGSTYLFRDVPSLTCAVEWIEEHEVMFAAMQSRTFATLERELRYMLDVLDTTAETESEKQFLQRRVMTVALRLAQQRMLDGPGLLEGFMLDQRVQINALSYLAKYHVGSTIEKPSVEPPNVNPKKYSKIATDFNEIDSWIETINQLDEVTDLDSPLRS